MLSHASQVVFISETTRKFFARLKFKRSPKIIFNGVDTEMYRPMKDAETLASLRRSYGLAETSTVILFVGRFVAKKGIPVMKYMVEMRPEWTWVFAGWGPLDPSSWNAANVRVFTNLWGSTMAALYRCCDLLVLPSTGEGFPLVIQEALASGIPVICGAETLGADSSMLEFARGAEITVGDDELTAQAFINAIEESLSQDRHSEEDSIKRRAYAESRYSWHRSAERYLEIITRLVQGAAKSEVSKVSRAG
jgi:glycosyltransferase involved in cell wall biosynthesis